MAIVVGKVSVKVYPDTSMWHEETKVELEKKSNNLKVTIPVVPDIENLQVLKTKITALNKAIKASDIKLEIPVTLDVHGLVGQLRSKLQELDAIARASAIKIPVSIDTSGGFVNPADGVKPVKIKVELDVDKGAINRVDGELSEVGKRFHDTFVQTNKNLIPDTLKDQGIGNYASRFHERFQAYMDAHSVSLKIDPSVDLTRAAAIVNLVRGIAAASQAWVDVGVRPMKASIQKAITDIKRDFKDAVELPLRIANSDASVVEARERIETLLQKNAVLVIQAKIDEASLNSARARFDKLSETVAKKKVVTEVDIISLRLAQLRIDSAMARGVQTKLGINVSEASILKAKAELKEAFDKAYTKAKVKPKLDMKGVAEVKAELGMLFGKVKALIHPEISSGAGAKVNAWFQRLSGFRVGRDLIEDTVKALGNLDKSVIKVMWMVPAIGSAVAAIIEMGGAILSLGRDVAKAVPIFLAVPTVFLGMAVMGAALMTSLAALKDYAPDVANAFKGLKKTMNDSFWKGALVPMREAATVLMPQIKSGMAAVSSATGSWFGDLLKQFAGLKSFGTFFTAVANMATGLKAMNGPLVSIFDTFFKMSEWLLPSFAGGLSNLTNKFAVWLKTANDSGKLQGWIEGAVQKFKDFWNLIVAVYDWLNALTRPLEKLNKMTIDSLASSFKRGAASMNSDIGQLNIKLIFEGAQKGMENFFTKAEAGLKKLGDALPGFLSTELPKLGDIGGTLFGAIAGGLADALPGISKLIDDIEYAVDYLAPKIETAIGQLGTTAGLTLGAMVKGFAPIIGDVLDVVNLIIPQIGKVIEDLSSGLQSVLGPIMPDIIDFIKYVADQMPGISKTIREFLEKMAPYIKEFAEVALPAIKKVIKEIQPILEKLFGVIVEAMPIVMPMIKDMWEGLGAAADLLGPIITDLLNTVKAVLKFIKDMQKAWTEFTDKLKASDAKGAFKGLAEDIGNGVKDLLQDMLVSFGVTILNIMKNLGFSDEAVKVAKDFIGGLVQGIITFMDDPGKQIAIMALRMLFAITDFFGIHSPSTKMYDVGKDLVDGIINAIVDFTQGAVGAIVALGVRVYSGFVDSIKGIAGAAASAVGRAVEQFGQMAGRAVGALGGLAGALWGAVSGAAAGMVAAAAGGVGSVAGVLKTLPGVAASAIGGIGSTLWNAGSSLISGFINGIRSMFSTVRSTLSSLTAMLPSWKGPLATDKVLFEPIGKIIMRSLISGFKSGAVEVKDYLNDFTSEIGNTEFLASITGSRNLASVDGPGANGATIRVTNYYPQAEPTSRTVNRALELATLL